MAKSPKEEVYEGLVNCPICGKTQILKTTDKEALKNPPRCFQCQNKEIKNA